MGTVLGTDTLQPWNLPNWSPVVLLLKSMPTGIDRYVEFSEIAAYLQFTISVQAVMYTPDFNMILLINPLATLHLKCFLTDIQTTCP